MGAIPCVPDFSVMVAVTNVSGGVGQVSAELMSAGTPWSTTLGVGRQARIYTSERAGLGARRVLLGCAVLRC